MSDIENLRLPESLAPKETIVDAGKVEINALPINEKGLILETLGFVALDTERVKEKGFLGDMEDPRYALREITTDEFGKVRAKVMRTTMGLYNRFHQLEKEEDLKNLEMATPTGGCAILLTTEKDGSKRMILQYRVRKNEYAFTPGASAGGIVKMAFDDQGRPLPLEDVIEIHITERIGEEVGLARGQFEVKIIGLATEKDPKIHPKGRGTRRLGHG